MVDHRSETTTNSRTTPRTSHTRTHKFLAVGFAAILMSAGAQATLVVDKTGENYLLGGAESVLLFSGPAAGSVSQIEVSFFFGPTTERGQEGWSRASDFALIVIAAGQTPRQWGGANVLFPGANGVGDWSFQGPDSGGPGNFDKTYSDVLTSGLTGLSGDGAWQIYVMNGFDDSDDVYYNDIQIVLAGLDVPGTAVQEGFPPMATSLCLAGTVGLLALLRAWRGRGRSGPV